MKRAVARIAGIAMLIPGFAVGTILAQKAQPTAVLSGLFDAVKGLSPRKPNVMFADTNRRPKGPTSQGTVGSATLDRIARMYGKDIVSVRGILVLEDTRPKTARADERLRAAKEWAEADGVGAAGLNAFSDRTMSAARQVAVGMPPGLHDLDSLSPDRRDAAIEVLYDAGSLTMTWRLRQLLESTPGDRLKPK